MLKSDLVIEHGIVYTMDPDRTVIDDGAIVIAGNRIIDIGKTEEIKQKYSAKKCIDASDQVILPGFINSHNHQYSNIGKHNPAFEGGLYEFCNRLYQSLEDMGEEEYYYASMNGAINLIKSGCTTNIDSVEMNAEQCAPGFLQAYDELGMRGIYSRTISDVNWVAIGLPGAEVTYLEDADEAAQSTMELINAWSEHDRLSVWPGLSYPPSSSDKLVENVSDICKKTSTGLAIHMSETSFDEDYWKQEKGGSHFQYYHRNFDILDNHIVAAHCCWVDEEDIHIMKETDVHVAHCAWSNMHGAGSAPISRFLEEGINVGLGTDDIWDVITNMNFTLLAHNIAEESCRVLDAYEVLEMATINGARALGLEKEIGSLVIGKKADIILFDMNQTNVVPFRNSIHCLIVEFGTSNNIHTVIIDGKVILENRAVLTVDESRIIRDYKASVARLIGY